MATGIVFYWNGASGWLKQTAVEDMCTSSANDCLFLAEDVTSGEIVQDCNVSFTTTASEPWLAHEVTVL